MSIRIGICRCDNASAFSMRRSAKPLYFEDMKRVLASRAKGVTGLAVAGMPVGAPGMEMPGRRGQPYDAVAFGPSGRRAFAHHG